MNNLNGTATNANVIDGVPTPWHRTVYGVGEIGTEQAGPLGLFARRVADLALSVQIEALNSSIQAVVHTAKVATAMAKQAAAMVPSQVPGFDIAADIAVRVENRLQSVADRATGIARKNVALASSVGEADATPGLAGDMIRAAFDFAILPMSTTADVAGAVGATRIGETTKTAAAAVANSALDALSVSIGSTTLDTLRIRETWIAMTTGPGKSVVSDVVNITSGLMRVALGDTQALGSALQTAIVNMNYPSQYGQNDLAYPRSPIGIVLADVAGLVVRYQPATFVSALGAGDYWGVANAVVEDAENIAAMSMLYPAGLVLVGVNVFRFLAIGLRDCNAVEAYVRAEHALAMQYPDLLDESVLLRLSGLPDVEALNHEGVHALAELARKRPLTCTEFEFYVGCAKSKTASDGVARGLLNHSSLPVGVFPQELIDLAQDTAFWYSCKILGRESGLLRMCRIYGAGVRDRLAADPSLDSDAGLDSARARALVEDRKDDPESLKQLLQLSADKNQAFLALAANNIYLPQQVRERRDFFTAVQMHAAA